MRCDSIAVLRACSGLLARHLRIHSRWFAPRATAIRATGGASANRDILQVIADVFDAEVVRGAPPNAASLGAALRAFHADRLAEGERLSWTDVVAGFTAPDASLRITPNPSSAAIYEKLLSEYEAFEQKLLGK